MEVLIKWESKQKNESQTCQVLISKAGSIHRDPFTNIEGTSNGVLDKFDLVKRSDKLYTRSLYLPLGLYHFLFHIVSSDGVRTEVSYYHNITVLGTGRSVNYIEVGAASPLSNTGSFSDCK